MKDKALSKVENEKAEKASPQMIDRLKELVKLWIEYSEEAAERVLVKDKTIKGLYEYCRTEAQKAAQNNCAAGGDEMLAEWLLKYYGASDPKGIAESGFVYFCLICEASKYKPYDETIAEDIRKKAEAVVGSPIADVKGANSQAVATAKAPDFSFDDLL